VHDALASPGSGRLRIPPFLRTTTVRLGLVYLGMFLASVLVILAVIYGATAGFMERQTDETIAAEIAGLHEQYAQRGLTGLVQVVAERAAGRRTNTLYLVTGPGMVSLAGNLSAWPAVPADAQGWVRFDIRDEHTRDGPHEARAITFALPGQFHLLVGRDLREFQQFRERLLRALAWALAITVGLGVIGGIAMARDAMGRIEAINRTTREIMSGDLRQRVRLSGGDDELDHLAANLNVMLDQIESLMTGMRHVTESIAHDLRTPLTRLRSRLEIALLSDQADVEVYRLVIQDTIIEADRLLATFTALLDIAKAESGGPEAFQPVDLAELAADAADLYEPVAEEKGLIFDTRVAGGGTVMGNRQLLAQALANLLDNAVKYTPAGGRIELEVEGATVTVADSGPGIPPDMRDKVLKRFVRLEASRSSPGNGLGLSLVDAVARMHGARLALEDNRPGLKVRFEFAGIQPQC